MKPTVEYAYNYPELISDRPWYYGPQQILRIQKINDEFYDITCQRENQELLFRVTRNTKLEDAPFETATIDLIESAELVNREPLLKTRGNAYGNAWRLTSETVHFILENSDRKENLAELMRLGLFYNWITILCKLLRVLGSPLNQDHWNDIKGYAELCAKRCVDENYQGEQE